MSGIVRVMNYTLAIVIVAGKFAIASFTIEIPLRFIIRLAVDDSYFTLPPYLFKSRLGRISIDKKAQDNPPSVAPVHPSDYVLYFMP